MVSKQANKINLLLVRTCIVLASVLLIGLVVAIPYGQNQIIFAEEKQEESPTEITKEQQSTNDEEDELSLTDVLNRNPFPKDYANKMNCVIADDVRQYDVLSSRFIVLDVRRIDEEVVIQFDAICLGLKPNSRLGFHMRTSNGRLCKDDHISVSSQDVFNATAGTSGSCHIPGFEKVSEVQLDQLKRGIALKVVE